jgi:hypothetical protein
MRCAAKLRAGARVFVVWKRGLTGSFSPEARDFSSPEGKQRDSLRTKAGRKGRVTGGLAGGRAGWLVGLLAGGFGVVRGKNKERAQRKMAAAAARAMRRQPWKILCADWFQEKSACALGTESAVAVRLPEGSTRL